MKSIRKAPRMQTLVLLALLPAFAILPTIGYANPFGEIVIHGDVSFSRDGNTLNIDQFTDKAIIHWEDFSIDSGEATVFHQPGSGSSALNRVTGSNASNIMGALRANGNVWLINPNGILFGPGSVVDVNGLLASTLDVSNDDFLDGGGFHLQGNSNASVKNFGRINTAQGGTFIAAQTVENHGYIGAVDGRVVMAGGGDVLVDSGVNGGHIMVNGTPNGGAHILNDGEVVASDIALKARNNNMWATAVNNKGALRANSVSTEGGRVVLSAEGGSGVNVEGEITTPGGDVEIGGGEITISGMVNTGNPNGVGGSVNIGSSSSVDVTSGATLDASGTSGGAIFIEAEEQTTVLGDVSADGTDGLGGEIKMSAHDIKIGGLASASGSAGGGEILIGGGVQGTDPTIGNAQSTTIESGAELNASATEDGDGGIVVAWSDGETDFQRNAAINAEGAGSEGTGGFVEVSGVETLSFAGAVSTAGDAADGTILLDPADVLITEPGGGGDIEGDALITALMGGDVVIHTTGTGGVGNITFDYNNSGASNLLTYDSSNDLSFFAHEDIIWDGFLNNDGSGNVTLVAGWDGDYNFGAAPQGAPMGTDRVTAANVLNGTFGEYGQGLSGQIILNNGFRTVGVGSAHGETNLFADLIDASTGNQNGEFVQIGYTNSRNPRATNALSVGDESLGNPNAGDINVYTNTAILMNANGGNARYLQIGHGGINRQSANRDPNGLGLTDLDGTGNTPDGNIHGDITVDGGLAIVFAGAGNDSGYRMIGHGGGSVTDEIEGNLSGDISVTAGVITMEAGQGNRAFAQIGHGGYDRKGEHSGDISVISTLGDIVMKGAPADAGNHSVSYAQIGHGGFDSDHINGLPIHVTYRSTSEGAVTGDYDFSPFATGTIGENRLGFEAPTVGQINDQNAAEGRSLFDVDETVEVEGVSGLTRKVGHHGDIEVVAARGIRFEAGSDDDDFAMIGHGGRATMGEFSGDIHVEAQAGGVVFDRNMRSDEGQGNRTFVQIGHGGHQSGAGGHGSISVLASGVIEFYGGRAASFAQIGHGGRQDIRGANNDPNAHDNNFAQGTLSGDIMVNAGSNIIFRSGFGRGGTQFSQIGHGGFENAAGIVESDTPVLEDLNGDGDTNDGDENNNYLGEGHNGDITVHSGGYIDFYAGQREFAVTEYVETSPGVWELVEILPADALRNGQDDYESNATDAYTQIGHGGRRAFGDHYGDIDIQADGIISIEATGGWDAIGYNNISETTGGPNNENNRGENVGDIDPDSMIPGIPSYNTSFQNNSRTGDRNYAQIGHGGHDAEHRGAQDGDRRDRTGASPRGYGYFEVSDISINSTGGGLRVIAAQTRNIGRQKDQFLTYDPIAGWVSPDTTPTETNFTDRIDPWTGLLLPGAVEAAEQTYAMVGHGGYASEIRGVDDVGGTGRTPGLYGDITVDVAGEIDVTATDFVQAVEIGSARTNSAFQSFNPTWVVGDIDNDEFLFNWENYDLAFFADAADGVIDGFIGDPVDGVTVEGYTVPGTTDPISGYDPADVIETINADNGGTELIGADGVLPTDEFAADPENTGYRSITPYLRQNGTTINNYNQSADSNDSFAMIGHGGRQSAQGVTVGDISLTSSGGGLHIDAGSSIRSFAKVGHGGYGGGPNNFTQVEGDITIDVLGDVRLDAGQREDAFAQIGHAGAEYNFGNNSLYTVRNADINVLTRQGDIVLDADNYYLEYSEDNPDYFATPDDPLYRTKVKDGPDYDASSGAASTLLVRNFNPASTNTALQNHRQEFAMIGHGGVQNDLDVDADITVEATQGSITMQSGPLNAQFTQIGHGGQFVDGGNANVGGTVLIGDVTVDAFGDINLTGGDLVSEFQLYGDNGNSAVPFSAPGILDNEGQQILEGNAAFPNDFTTSGQNTYYAYSMIGHGGNRLGNGNRGTRIEGNISVNTVLTDRDPDSDIILDAGDGRGAYALIGHGGTEVDNGEGFFGNITVNASRDILIRGGERLRNGGDSFMNEENFAQIGHSTMKEPGGGSTLGANSEGDIYVTAGRDISLLAGGGSYSHARIGSGANLNSANQTQLGDHAGDVTVIAGGDLTMQGGRIGSEDLGHEFVAEYVEGEINTGVDPADDALFAFAQIGHGGAGNDSQAGFEGNIDVKVGGDLIMNGDVLDENGDPVLIESSQYAPEDSVAQSGIAVNAYTKIGHGDYLTFSTGTSAGGFASGNVSVAVGDSAYIKGGIIGNSGTGSLIPIQGSTIIGVSRNDPFGGGVLSVGSLTVPQEATGITGGTVVESDFNSGFVGDGSLTPNVGQLLLYMPNRAANMLASGTLLNGQTYLAPSGPQRIGEEWVPYPEFTFSYDTSGLPMGSFNGSETDYTFRLGYGVYYADEFGVTGDPGGGGNTGGGNTGGGTGTGGVNDGTGGAILPPEPEFTPLELALIDFYNASIVKREQGRELNPDLAKSLEVLREFYGDPSNGTYYEVEYDSQGLDSSDLSVMYPGPGTKFEVFDYGFLHSYLDEIPPAPTGGDGGNVSAEDVLSEEQAEPAEPSDLPPDAEDPFSFE